MDDKMFDKWSLAHLTSGFIGKKLGMSFTQIIIASCLWEIFEYKVAWEWFPEPTAQDQKMNIIGDTICVIVGWSIA